jgi:hypothetical protein
MARPGQRRRLFRNLGCRAALTAGPSLPGGSAHPALVNVSSRPSARGFRCFRQCPPSQARILTGPLVNQRSVEPNHRARRRNHIGIQHYSGAIDRPDQNLEDTRTDVGPALHKYRASSTRATVLMIDVSQRVWQHDAAGCQCARQILGGGSRRGPAWQINADPLALIKA